MYKNALVSVSDKTGLVEFLRPLVEKGLRIVSTGGTAEHLKKNGFKVVDISEQTGFPEVMGGRVKTLHPNVHMALLSRVGNAEDDKLLAQSGLQPFDLLICNLYPFEQAYKKNVAEDKHKSDLVAEDLIEQIDIGGPTLLRGSAKNFARMTVLCDPADYNMVLGNENSIQQRQYLAAKVFAHVSCYDSLVAQALGYYQQKNNQAETVAQDLLLTTGRKVLDLRYGENPQQWAGWYQRTGAVTGLHQSQILQGKPLSYNNILDVDAALRLASRFENPTAVAVKHNNPCGVASSDSLSLALRQAVQSDPVSVFGGIIAVNRPLQDEDAEVLASIFLECVIAPDFSSGFLQKMSAKKNVRLLKSSMPANDEIFAGRTEIRSVWGGILLQSNDKISSGPQTWKIHQFNADCALTEKIKADLVFAERVCADLKSNAIAIASGEQTLGLGMGQVNRVDAVQHAIARLKQFFPNAQDHLVLASDAFFPFADSIELAAKAGVRWVIQPGGSLKDAEVLERAKELQVNIVLTGERHFRH